MTVAELITYLQGCPPEGRVFHMSEFGPTEPDVSCDVGGDVWVCDTKDLSEEDE